MSDSSTWIKFYEADGVLLGKHTNFHGSYLVIADSYFAHYRITISARGGRYHVGIGAELFDDQPGQLADYTPRYEYDFGDYTGDDIAITDEGLLTVLVRQRAASHVDIRVGFTAQLPTAFVVPIRKALDMLRDGAAGDNPASGFPSHGTGQEAL